MTADEWVARTLAKAKPLTEDQRTKLAELLRPVRQPNIKQRKAVAEFSAPDQQGSRHGGDAA